MRKTKLVIAVLALSMPVFSYATASTICTPASNVYAAQKKEMSLRIDRTRTYKNRVELDISVSPARLVKNIKFKANHSAVKFKKNGNRFTVTVKQDALRHFKRTGKCLTVTASVKGYKAETMSIPMTMIENENQMHQVIWEPFL